VHGGQLAAGEAVEVARLLIGDGAAAQLVSLVVLAAIVVGGAWVAGSCVLNGAWVAGSGVLDANHAFCRSLDRLYLYSPEMLHDLTHGRRSAGGFAGALESAGANARRKKSLSRVDLAQAGSGALARTDAGARDRKVPSSPVAAERHGTLTSATTASGSCMEPGSLVGRVAGGTGESINPECPGRQLRQFHGVMRAG
jgi:hypothetical protein